MTQPYNTADIARIAEMLAEDMTPAEIAERLNVDAADSFFADREDDSDEGIARRYGISADDRFDIRGECLLPRLNDAGEPNWF
jgi:hypothetical protein